MGARVRPCSLRIERLLPTCFEQLQLKQAGLAFRRSSAPPQASGRE
jgi:hypothetical protein